MMGRLFHGSCATGLEKMKIRLLFVAAGLGTCLTGCANTRPGPDSTAVDMAAIAEFNGRAERGEFAQVPKVPRNQNAIR